MNILPLWKSHYSLTKSILTLEKAGESTKTGPASIIDLALENNLSQVHLVDDSFSGFLEAYKNTLAANLQLVFGLRLTFCKNIEDKSEESLKSNCKFIIKALNEKGYKRLIKIFTLAAGLKGFYYEPRLDFEVLKEFWSEEDLELCVPFYDSFIFKNILTMGLCVPDFSYARPAFYLESNDLPYDHLIENRIKEFCQGKYEIIRTKSIYYNKREDFKAYMTLRCIGERTTLEKPELQGMFSPEFCVESWKEQNNS